MKCFAAATNWSDVGENFSLRANESFQGFGTEIQAITLNFQQESLQFRSPNPTNECRTGKTNKLIIGASFYAKSDD